MARNNGPITFNHLTSAEYRDKICKERLLARLVNGLYIKENFGKKVYCTLLL